MDIVTVMDFGQVIKRPRLLGKGQQVLAAVVLNADIAFFNVDIRRPVFAHGPQLDQVAVGLKFLDGEQYVEGSDDIVYLAKDGVAAVDHGVRSGPLLGEMDHRLRRKLLHDFSQEFIVENISDGELDLLTCDSLPSAESLGQGANGRESLRAQFVIPGTAMKTIDNGDVIATPR